VQFDLKIPIGLLFSLYGVLLTLDGAFGSDAPFAQAHRFNINLTWGLLMLFFGIAVLVFNQWRRGRRP
jgi:hypothetical protein